MEPYRLTPMKKVEIVAAGADFPAIRATLVDLVSGFTVVPNVSGLGHDGYHEGRLLFNDQAPLMMIVTVVRPGELEAVLDGVLPLLERHSGVLFVSDVAVSRAEYFAPGVRD